MFSSPLLGRARSWAVLSSLLVCLLLVPSAGRAGSYSLTSQTGGISLAHTDGQTYSSSYSPTSAGYGAGAGTGWHPGGMANDASCTGPIKTVFTWMPGYPGEPPPPCAIEIQTCTARYDDVTGGSCFDGLGSDPGDSGNGTGGGHVCSKTLYTVQNSPGASFTETCSPSASISGPANYFGGTNGTVSVYYSASLIIPPLLQAHSTIDTANWDPFHPRFFSGTNCSVAGTATAYRPRPGSYPTGGTYVKEASLFIGGTVVRSYYDTSVPGPYPSGAVTGANQGSVPLSAFFDSTHFADNTPISIQMTVTDSGGLTYTVPIAANAYNKPYPLGNDQSTGGQLLYGQAAAQNASAQFSAMNYAATAPTTSDGKAAILNNLPTYTGFYTWTHGLDLASQFGDCFAHINSPDTNYLFANAADDTTGARSVTQSVGGKTLFQPAYNFVFLDACSTSQNNIMAGAFGITTSSTDLAYLGYTTSSDDSPYNRDWSNRVMVDLAGGFTVADAVTDANQVVGYPLLAGQHASTYIWGDKATKVHGVFGGAGTQWSK